MENRAFGALLAALLLCCAYSASAAAEPLRVLYAEPFEAQATSTPGAQKAGPPGLRIRAFGRTFELELEDNSRLLHAASAQTRERLGAIQVFKGSIRNAPGSWVRLTLSSGRYSGAFWDGSELYAIAPRETLEGALLTPMPSSATGIYRLSDTQGGLFGGTCGLDSRARAQSTPTQKFRALIQELQGAVAVAPIAAREIEISMIGDFEFTSRRGALSIATMVDQMNVVDGIFSNQVGVATVPTDFITFGNDVDPFTASDAQTLLNQLAAYRETTPVVRNRGLAHLLTGRELAGNTIGIAFLGSLCAARQGVSLSESSGFIDSPLIMAHELGHNFGAPHDGEVGSRCAGVPSSFLMGPSFNSSSNFSACSLAEIGPVVDAASCVVAARNRDVAVTAPPDKIYALINAPFDVTFDVSSLGNIAASNVLLSVQIPSAQNVISTAMPGATCTVEGSTVRCRLPTLNAGATARLTLRMRHPASTLLNYRATVSSVGDSNDSNNVATARVRIAEARDFDVATTPATQTVPRNTPFEVTFDVAAIGSQTVNDMQLQLSIDATLQSFTIDNGSCAPQGNFVLACQLGTMAPGARRRVRAQMVIPTRVGSIPGVARLFEAANPGFLRSESFEVVSQPLRDISLVAIPQSKVVATGADAIWPVEVHSNGVQAVNGVRVRLTAPTGVTLSVDDPIGAGCTTIAGGLDCAIGTLAAGAVTTFTLRARANTPLIADIALLSVLPTQDDIPSNDRAQLRLDARVGSEISLSGLMITIADVEGRTETLSFLVHASGANPSQNVQLAVSLPQGFTISSGQLFSGQCTVRAGAPNIADCTAASLATNSSAEVSINYIPAQPGTFDGSISVSATEDADPANNSLAPHFEVAPAVDARIVAPTDAHIAVGIVADLVFTVSTNRYALPNASVVFRKVAGLDVFSATAPGATCSDGPQALLCSFASIAANSSVPVTLQIRGDAPTTVQVSASLSSPAETNVSDNQALISLPIRPQGDMAISVANASPSVTVGEQWHLLIDVNVLTEVHQSYFELQFDPAQLQLMGTMNGAVCLSSAQPARCFVGTSGVPAVLAPGTYRADVIFVASSAGAAKITVRGVAVNDFNASNDTQVATSTATKPAPPPPPPPPPPTGGGGGGSSGGGGSMNWLVAALLFAMWHHRRTRVHR